MMPTLDDVAKQPLEQLVRRPDLKTMAGLLAHLASLSPQQWQRGGIHPTRGRMTVEDFVTTIAWHDDNHLDQLRRALDGRA